jgi:hypothetical protein
MVVRTVLPLPPDFLSTTTTSSDSSSVWRDCSSSLLSSASAPAPGAACTVKPPSHEVRFVALAHSSVVGGGLTLAAHVLGGGLRSGRNFGPARLELGGGELFGRRGGRGGALGARLPASALSTRA